LITKDQKKPITADNTRVLEGEDREKALLGGKVISRQKYLEKRVEK